ncbi:MAG: outer membrane protein [Pontibacterium sp.]
MKLTPALLVAGAIASSHTYAMEFEDFYIGAALNASVFNYNDIEFINPRINHMDSGNDSQTAAYTSLSIGTKIPDQPIRLELEYGDVGEHTFTSFWDPFSNYQKVTVESQYLMLNALYDYQYDQITFFGGAGLGVAKNSTKAAQEANSGPDNTFAENKDSNVSFALIAGAAIPVTDDINITAEYKYLTLGTADSGISEFGPQDEHFKGTLASNQITLGVTYSF